MVKSFKQFLKEALSIKPTSYGMNKSCDDSVIKTMDMGNNILHVTYFIHDGIKCKVLYYSDGVFAYGVTSKDNDKKWILQPSNKDSSKMNMFSLYSKVLFLLTIFIKEFNITHIEFSGSEDKLNHTYSMIFNKASFIKMMNELGFNIGITSKDGSPLFVADKIE